MAHHQHDQYERLRGKRFVAIVRCSTAEQSETSIPDQLAVVRNFANRYGMVEVDVIELAGVSGSIPGNREDLQALLDRKRDRDDFEVLLLQDTTRLTRGGSMHGMKTEFDFRAVGIEIVFVLEQMPEGPAGDLYKTFQYYSANEQARSIAKNAARGAMSAMEQGRLSHARRPPFAVDRLYVGSDGRPRHIIRNLSDGTQVKLDPQTGGVIERLGRNPKTGKPARYLKQPDESVQLVMGDPQLVDAVRHMFRRYLIDGHGGWRIAAELDAMHVPAPTVERWNRSSVMVILRNPTYTGSGTANRISTGIYYNRAPGAPRTASTQLKDLAGRKRPKRTLRPREEWLSVEQSGLAEFLPSDLRDLAIAYQTSYWRRMDERRAQPRRDKHADSSFILKGLLTSKQGAQPMTGKRCGPVGNKTPYYMVTRARQFIRVENPIWRRMVPAAPLEQLVLRLLQQALLAAPNLKAILRKHIERQFASRAGQHQTAASLTARRAKLQRQRSFLIENIDVIGEDEARRELADVKQELDTIGRQLAEAITAEPWDARKVEQTVDELTDQLRQSAEVLRSLPQAALQRMLNILVERLEVDLESRAVGLTLRLPTWAIEAPQRLGYEMCLKATSARKDGHEAHAKSTVPLMRFRVFWLGRSDGYIGYGIAA